MDAEPEPITGADPALGPLPRERLAQLVSAATYGSVLVLAALTVIGVSEVAEGHGGELVAGVGLATWVAHLFAELSGDRVLHSVPLDRSEVGRAAADGAPILAATVLPAVALMLGRLDVLGDATARWVAIGLALVQLFAIGAYVGHVAPSRRGARWHYAAVVAGLGAVVVAVTTVLGH
jgi:hypothetical protein